MSAYTPRLQRSSGDAGRGGGCYGENRATCIDPASDKRLRFELLISEVEWLNLVSYHDSSESYKEKEHYSSGSCQGFETHWRPWNLALELAPVPDLVCWLEGLRAALLAESAESLVPQQLRRCGERRKPGGRR
jgi:hypothetical protein